MKLDELTIPEVSDCDPQVEPMGAKVLVVPAEIPEKVGSIFLTNDTHGKKEYANQRGRIVAVGPCAFVFDDWPKGYPTPQVGDVILHEAYIGDTVEGEDGKKYRLMNDRAVTAVLKRAEPVLQQAQTWDDPTAILKLLPQEQQDKAWEEANAWFVANRLVEKPATDSKSPVELTNEYNAAVAAGDTERGQFSRWFAKTYPKQFAKEFSNG